MVTHISGQSLRRQIFFWLVVLAAFIAFLMLFSSILLPFVAGMALAYFLDPVADRLERWGLSRMMATAVILLTFLLLLILGLLIIIPLLATQAADFAVKVPGYITTLQQMLSDANSHYLPAWLKGQMGTLKENFSKYIGEGASFIAGLFVQIWASGKALVDVLSLLVITPVVAFYLLLGWAGVVALQPLSERLPVSALTLLIAGGLTYVAGVGFYLWTALRFHNAIWHSFVAAASALQFAAVALALEAAWAS